MIVVIADDLSGASELANAARQCGLTAEVQQAFEPSAPSDVCAVNVDSRAMDPLASMRRMADVTRQVAAAQPQWFFKKVDSMLRGHVGLEIESMLAAMNADRALLVPANPSRGRVIRRARYCVEDRPLHQTTLAADPEFPRTTAEIRELVGTTSLPVLAGVRSPDSQGPMLFVPDAESQQDIDRHAQRADDFPLVAGGIDLFLAVLERRAGVQANPLAGPLTTADYARVELLICGSKASWMDRVASCGQYGIPWFTLPSEWVLTNRRDLWLRWIDDILPQVSDAGRAVLGLGLATTYEAAMRHVALTQLAAAAQGLGQRLSIQRWLLEGGATANAILKATGRLRFPLGNPMPHGCAELLAGSGDPEQRWYVKPGSYPWPREVWPNFGVR